jgi:hypothetical protein
MLFSSLTGTCEQLVKLRRKVQIENLFIPTK